MELRDFLEEISLMKMIGFHKNIVNFIGCSTVLKPFFLVLELMKHGDLLHFLRKRRAKVSVHAFLLVHIVYRNMVRKHCYKICYSENMLNIRSCGFDRAHYCIIKFSKQLAKTFVKISNGSKSEFPSKHSS